MTMANHYPDESKLSFLEKNVEIQRIVETYYGGYLGPGFKNQCRPELPEQSNAKSCRNSCLFYTTCKRLHKTLVEKGQVGVAPYCNEYRSV